MLSIGVQVRVKPPFDAVLPGVYTIEAQSETGAWQIAGGIDFAAEFLEVI